MPPLFLKTIKATGEENKALQASKGWGFAQRSVLLKHSVATTAPGPGPSQAPAVRTCFIFGPSTESRKPHLLTSFSFKITHSSMSLVEKASIREFLSLFQERIGKTETQTPFLGKQHPPSKRPKQVCATSYPFFKLHFILPPASPPPRATHTKQAAPQAEIVFGFI